MKQQEVKCQVVVSDPPPRASLPDYPLGQWFLWDDHSGMFVKCKDSIVAFRLTVDGELLHPFVIKHGVIGEYSPVELRIELDAQK